MDSDDRQKAKDNLNQHYDWPCVYKFKFIVPTVPNREKELMGMFSVDVEVTFPQVGIFFVFEYHLI